MFKFVFIFSLSTTSAMKLAEAERDGVYSDISVEDEMRLDRVRYKRSDVLNKLLESAHFNLNNQRLNDPFAFLQDDYPLPEGLAGPLKEYDFIVVGAGSAGSVLASRLSEKKFASVLLLEAGRPESSLTDIPILAPLLQQTYYTWPYRMEKTEGLCLGMEDQRCPWPRGRAVGGTSVINYMVYTRGNPEDWDRIARDGNPGWSYADVLPYFLKSERATLRGVNYTWHGRDGRLSVENVPFRSKLSKAFMEAASYLGHRLVDYNAPDGFGFGYIQSTTRAGHRHSTAKAFLHNRKKRTNLHILPRSRVTKILIDTATKTAYGIEFYRNGYKYNVTARKEVIISAGPIASPQLLMLSGIGPKEHLKELDIPLVQDLRVGQSMYDHLTFPSLTFLLNTSGLTMKDYKVSTIYNVNQYWIYGDGPMSSVASAENVGYIKTTISKEPGDYPDIELVASCSSLAGDQGEIVRKGLHITDKIYNEYFKPIESYDSFTIVMMLLHPQSKGHILLKDSNPFHHPKLYGNYMTHRTDVDTMIAAIRHVIRLVETPPYQKYGARLYTKPLNNCAKHEFSSDDYWECALRTLALSLQHQIGTCRMGHPEDPNAVVDPELRVYGVNRLRVVDSSVIPRTISAHMNAPAIMIGEKAADMIKRTWS